MSAGIAKNIKQAFPAAYQADLATQAGNTAKLGTYSLVRVEANGKALTIINTYTQLALRGAGRKANYQAIRAVFQRLKHHFSGKRIGYLAIGTGLAGGEWPIMVAIIDEELAGEAPRVCRMAAVAVLLRQSHSRLSLTKS